MPFTYHVADEAADFFHQAKNEPSFTTLCWMVEELLLEETQGTWGILAGFIPSGKPAMYATDLLSGMKTDYPQRFVRGAENGTYWVALFPTVEMADAILHHLRPPGTPFNHNEGTPFVAQVSLTKE